MDVKKLQEDFAASQALLQEEQAKAKALDAKNLALEGEKSALVAEAEKSRSEFSQTIESKDAEIKRLELSEAGLKGQITALEKQVTELQAEAKTASARAADFVRGNAVAPFDNTPNASQRSASGKEDLAGLSGRDKAAAAINQQFSKPTE